jgi:uncharacterized membrane protein
MKKKLSTIFGVVCVIAIFAGAVEGIDGGITAWNFICLAVAGLSGWASKKMEGAK